MKLISDVLKRNRTALLIFALITAADLAVFLLYGLILEPFLYAFVIAAVFLLGILAVDLAKEKRQARLRSCAVSAVTTGSFELPGARTLAEEDYQSMIRSLCEQMQGMTAAFDSRNQETLDYMTAWVHQIKTPIAVLRLKCSEDTPQNRAIAGELFRIEQYVNMVLQYVRLGSDTNDLVIREYDLDELIREAVRKYAPRFIEKKLKLVYIPVRRTVVTDQKWFLCILEQLLSNAVKYTPEGTVSVSMQGNCLRIADTGIGIAPEDLPRIFEKGYTGQNGRIGEQSSGLGLYLAKKAADLISVTISVESTVGKGTAFLLAAEDMAGLSPE